MLHNKDYLEFLESIKESVDLILTDPPYNISRESGFSQGKLKKYKSISMDFGAWDYFEIDLNKFAKVCYARIRDGGTCIVFYDFWKLSLLKEAFESAGFSKTRLIIWEKTNAVPINSKISYLSNPREFALSFIKGTNATFNSEYDNGVYNYSIPQRFKHEIKHATQKPLKLFEALILKHSNEQDLVVDPFLGSGTTAIACVKNNRHYICNDINEDYLKLTQARLDI